MRVLLKDHDDHSLTAVEVNYMTYDAEESCLWLSLQDGSENIKVSGTDSVTITISTGNSIVQESFRTGTSDLSNYQWDWSEE